MPILVKRVAQWWEAIDGSRRFPRRVGLQRLDQQCLAICETPHLPKNTAVIDPGEHSRDIRRNEGVEDVRT